MLWEKIIIKLLPRAWEYSFKKIEKQNLVTKALEGCWKNKLLRNTWLSFCNAVISWLQDAKAEVEECKRWYAER